MIGTLALAGEIDAQTSSGSQSAKPSGSTTSKDNVSFEVFSIKRNKSIHMPGGGELLPDGFRATGLTLWELIMYAYGPPSLLDWSQVKIQNLPDWASDEFYDVDARVASKDVLAWSAQKGIHRELLDEAMRIALKERCKLALHIIPSEIPYYSLVVTKQGAKLDASVPGSQPPKQGVPLPYGGIMTPSRHDGLQVWTFHAVTMQSLAAFLTNPIPVQDKTGLTGQYDFSLQELSRDNQADDPGGQLSRWPISKLGLTLKSDKGPSLTLVIDHIERPDQN